MSGAAIASAAGPRATIADQMRRAIFLSDDGVVLCMTMSALDDLGILERPTYEMTAEEILDALLVPSNHGEYLSEIVDRARREDTIRELMLGEVLPTMARSEAATALGLNVRWALGDFGDRARSQTAPVAS